MKRLFPGYYHPSQPEIEALWANGTFVFDTSVLLNLYSYPEQAREDVLNLLKEVAPSTWIPYQVIMEFHRNRYARINSGNGPLIKLEGDIVKMSRDIKAGFKAIDYDRRNTGVNDLEARLTVFQQASDVLIEALKLAKQKLPKPGLHDEIAAELANIYEDPTKIGEPPQNQEELQAIFADGEVRFNQKIPPGFADARTKDAVYRSGGLRYEARFGDLVVWKQLIAYAKNKGLEYVVLVTAERKDDWWLKGDGKEDILGPHPELIDEFVRETGVKFFWLYSIDEFLAESKNRTKNEINPETLVQVRAVDAELEQIPLSWADAESDDNLEKHENDKGYNSRFQRYVKKRILEEISELFTDYLIENGAREIHQRTGDFYDNTDGPGTVYRLVATDDPSKIRSNLIRPDEFKYESANKILVIVVEEDRWLRRSKVSQNLTRNILASFATSFGFSVVWLFTHTPNQLKFIQTIEASV